MAVTIYPDGSRVGCTVKDAVPLFPVGGIRCVHNGWYKGLWIQVVEREPGALNLHHDPVPGQESVAHMGQGDLVFQGRVRPYGLRLFKIFPVPST